MVVRSDEQIRNQVLLVLHSEEFLIITDLKTGVGGVREVKPRWQNLLRDSLPWLPFLPSPVTLEQLVQNKQGVLYPLLGFFIQILIISIRFKEHGFLLIHCEDQVLF